MKIFAITVLSVLAFVVTSIAFGASSAPSAPVGLLVNGVNNPLAIDRNAIRFTWMSTDATRGERQTAYQILVASTPKLLAAGTGDYWDSGKADSDKSASIEYGGKLFPAASRFWWKVRLWDQTEKPSLYSEPNYFDTGLNQSEWTAQYIWDGTTNQNNFAYFRKTFQVTQKPDLAKVYVTARNDYLLYCNGQELGRGPARCDPYNYGQYQKQPVPLYREWYQSYRYSLNTPSRFHHLNRDALSLEPAQSKLNLIPLKSKTVGLICHEK